MDDLISRQAAIDALGYCQTYLFDSRDDDKKISLEDAEYAIEQLPPAQPELCEDAVSRQRLLSDLKELVAAWKKYPVMAEQIKGVEAAIGYVELIPSVKPNSKELSETHKALDIISRQAAILAIEEYADRLQMVNWKENPGVPYKAYALNWAINTLRDLPSAERRGRWIEEYSANHFQAKCSACGESTLYGITYDLEGNAYYMNYCPNCGARMEGGE